MVGGNRRRCPFIRAQVGKLTVSANNAPQFANFERRRQTFSASATSYDITQVANFHRKARYRCSPEDRNETLSPCNGAREKSAFFLKRGSRNSGNRDVTQPTSETSMLTAVIPAPYAKRSFSRGPARFGLRCTAGLALPGDIFGKKCTAIRKNRRANVFRRAEIVGFEHFPTSKE
jgi:hypothetical protein